MAFGADDGEEGDEREGLAGLGAGTGVAGAFATIGSTSIESAGSGSDAGSSCAVVVGAGA